MQYFPYADICHVLVQYAFIAFLMGHSLEAFMQWKAILQLALQCSSVVAAHGELFLKLLSALHAQLTVALQPSSDPQITASTAQASTSPMLMDGLLESNYLQPLLIRFNECLEDIDCLDMQLLVCLPPLCVQCTMSSVV